MTGVRGQKCLISWYHIVFTWFRELGLAIEKHRTTTSDLERQQENIQLKPTKHAFCCSFTYFHHSSLKLRHSTLWKNALTPRSQNTCCSCRGLLEATHFTTKAWQHEATYLGSTAPLCWEMIPARMNRALRREVGLAILYSNTTVIHRLSWLKK